MTSSSNKMWWHPTSTRLFRTTWTRYFPRDEYVVQQPITSCGADGRQDHQIQLCATSSCKTIEETWRSSCLLRYLCQILRSELLHHSFHYYGHCTKFVTSWIIVSIRAMWLAEGTFSFCKVFFSINKFRCEVLSTSHLFSVSFSKSKVLFFFLPCSFKFDYGRNCIKTSFIILTQSRWKNHGEYDGHGM